MTEKPDPRTRLVAEVFNDDWVTGSASVFALRAAAHARRRRTMRHALAAGSAAAMAIAAILFFARVPVSPPRPAASSAAPVAAGSPAFEIISDEELVAALRDRPLLVLPQESGAKRFVLLDR